MRSRAKVSHGLSLLEMMFAIALTGLVGSLFIGVLLHQGRSYRRAGDVMHAQQGLRAALDLMSAELRIASPTDLLAAETDSVAVRSDLWRAVVCDSTGPDEATLVVFDSVTTANLPSAFRGTAVHAPYDVATVYADGWTGVVTTTGGGPRGRCLSRGAPGGWRARAYRTVTGWSSGTGSVPSRGSRVRRYGRLSFRFRPSSYGRADALWRNGAELVSPFRSGTTRFRYRLADGSTHDRVAGRDLGRVRMVRVEFVASGEGSSGAGRAMTHDIWLRN